MKILRCFVQHGNPCVLIACMLAAYLACDGTPDEPEYVEIALQVHELVNEHRISQGLDSLGWNETIAQEGYEHSHDMADGIVPFGHDGFNDRVDHIAQKLEITITRAGENVAYNYNMSDPAQAAVDAWLGSTGHRQNIEGDFHLTGVGVACPANDSLTYYFTQIFIKN
jgi:uncharacterized protein YkwD